MYRVSDDEVEFILNDIKQRGVEMEDLQLNLLDHICCILEKEKLENEDFETAYQKVIKQFFKHALWEIEEETILLLKYRNYYKMKRFLYILLFLSIGFNVFMFSNMGYNYYKQKKWMDEHMINSSFTFKSGLNDLEEKLADLKIKLPKKDYTTIYFMGDPWYSEEDRFSDVDEDLYDIKKARENLLKQYKSIDSVAGIYNKNINHIICYESDNDETKKRIEELAPKFKNLVFITGMNSIISGYFNDKKSKMKFTPKIFIINSNKDIIYDNPLSAEKIHIELTKQFKTLSK